jgi:hypothetical protein
MTTREAKWFGATMLIVGLGLGWGITLLSDVSAGTDSAEVNTPIDWVPTIAPDRAPLIPFVADVEVDPPSSEPDAGEFDIQALAIPELREDVPVLSPEEAYREGLAADLGRWNELLAGEPTDHAWQGDVTESVHEAAIGVAQIEFGTVRCGSSVCRIQVTRSEPRAVDEWFRNAQGLGFMRASGRMRPAGPSGAATIWISRPGSPSPF